MTLASNVHQCLSVNKYEKSSARSAFVQLCYSLNTIMYSLALGYILCILSRLEAVCVLGIENNVTTHTQYRYNRAYTIDMAVFLLKI